MPWVSQALLASAFGNGETGQERRSGGIPTARPLLWGLQPALDLLTL